MYNVVFCNSRYRVNVGTHQICQAGWYILLSQRQPIFTILNYTVYTAVCLNCEFGLFVVVHNALYVKQTANTSWNEVTDFDILKYSLLCVKCQYSNEIWFTPVLRPSYISGKVIYFTYYNPLQLKHTFINEYWILVVQNIFTWFLPFYICLFIYFSIYLFIFLFIYNFIYFVIIILKNLVYDWLVRLFVCLFITFNDALNTF